MNAISPKGDVRPDRLRLPALPVADSAGTSFKHEHLSAILAENPLAGFFEVHAENYMGAGGPPHQALERPLTDDVRQIVDPCSAALKGSSLLHFAVVARPKRTPITA